MALMCAYDMNILYNI